MPLSLGARRAEAAIVADISAAVEEDLDSGDEFSDGADDDPDSFDELHNGRGSLLQASSEARGHSSSTQHPSSLL